MTNQRNRFIPTTSHNNEQQKHKIQTNCMITWNLLKGSEPHLFCPVVFSFCVEEFKGSTPCLRQRSQHVPIGCWAEMTKTVNIIVSVIRYSTALTCLHPSSGVPLTDKISNQYPHISRTIDILTTSDLRPHVKRRLCCTLFLISFKVSSAFWM